MSSSPHDSDASISLTDGGTAGNPPDPEPEPDSPQISSSSSSAAAASPQLDESLVPDSSSPPTDVLPRAAATDEFEAVSEEATFASQTLDSMKAVVDDEEEEEEEEEEEREIIFSPSANQIPEESSESDSESESDRPLLYNPDALRPGCREDQLRWQQRKREQHAGVYLDTDNEPEIKIRRTSTVGQIQEPPPPAQSKCCLLF
jgi:hypothetical protein